MAFLSFTLTALLSATSPSIPAAAMACQFGPEDNPDTWVSVRPAGETDTPGLFRVQLWIEGSPLIGNVVALDKTDERDVVVRGMTRDRTTWLIAVRDNGAAYLQRKAATPEAEVLAANGQCSHLDSAFNEWLTAN